MVPEHGEGSQADSASVHSYPAFIRQHPGHLRSLEWPPGFLGNETSRCEALHQSHGDAIGGWNSLSRSEGRRRHGLRLHALAQPLDRGLDAALAVRNAHRP
jgi:hypothetical protein